MLKHVAVVAASLALVVCRVPLRAEIIEQVLVKVNGDIITKRISRRGRWPSFVTAQSLRKPRPNSPNPEGDRARSRLT